MCGIAGIIDLNHSVPFELIKRMADTIIHRGPDAEGFYQEDGVALGHRRLSIIDLPGGGQPIRNEDKSIWVIFNGEIYNYRKLTQELKEAGHTFYTNSDTETLVHLYEDYGDDCVHHLRGMFAFALWDVKRKRLLAARDRVGKKPLSYHYRPGKLVFGSEIKAILCDQSINQSISHAAIDQYLTFGYVPSPYTIYSEIRKLPAGHLLTYENDQLITKRYWNPIYVENGLQSEAEVISEIERLLMEATSLRMIADVPLGAFLSGGVDSSLIAALMSKLSGQPVKTFTIGFEEEDFSELPYARLVAKHLGTEHHELILKPDIINILEELLHQYDEPFADSSMIPTYLVSKLARQHVTVALSGDGGDEVFAGYNRYTNLALSQRLDRIPGVRQLAGLASAAPMVSAPLRRKLRIVAQPSYKRQLILSSVISEELRQQIYTPEFQSSLSDSQPNEVAKLYLSKPDRLNKWLYSDLLTYLPNDILVKVDRASMLTSLETRAPILDHYLIEFMAAVPSHLKTRHNMGKYLLKKLAEKYVPQEVLYRKKMGFSVPLKYWFKGPLKDIIENQLLSKDALTSRFLKQELIRKTISLHRSNYFDYSPTIFALLYLELWLRRFAPHV